MYLISRTGSSYDERNQFPCSIVYLRVTFSKSGQHKHKQPQIVFSVFVGYLGTAKYLSPLHISMT